MNSGVMVFKIKSLINIIEETYSNVYMNNIQHNYELNIMENNFKNLIESGEGRVMLFICTQDDMSIINTEDFKSKVKDISSYFNTYSFTNLFNIIDCIFNKIYEMIDIGGVEYAVQFKYVYY